MLNVRMVAFAFFAVILAGCATRESPRSLYEHRSSVALEKYVAGSGQTPFQRYLLLFADNHWEQWGVNCTQQWMIGFGRYEKSGNTYTLTEKKKPTKTLYVYRAAPNEYLLTKAQRRTGVTEANAHEVLLLMKPNP